MKEYCYNCEKKVEYVIKDKVESLEVRGIDFGYTAHAAYCKECGNEVYVSAIKKENSLKVNKRYEEIKSMI